MIVFHKIHITWTYQSHALHTIIHTLFTEEKTLFKMPAMRNIEQQLCQIDRKKREKEQNTNKPTTTKSKTRPQGLVVIGVRAVCQTKEEKPAVGG